MNINNIKVKDSNIKVKTLTKSENSKIKEMSYSQTWEASTLKTSSVTKDSSVSNDPTIDSFGITDPTLYFKKLNQIINRKLIIILVIVPIIFMLFYNIYVTINQSDLMGSSCVNENRMVSTPKLVLCSVIVASSFFLFYQAYKKQKWDREIRVEYLVFIVSLIMCKFIKII
ncbi:hypothetical protein PIROE2DRAFT_2915 [Piromyces sp. E2]|nr:hypothetical protein PIROE2DRAFT_2915 [Piromyces sp. E2]|eukprot:OUM69212.1 hypothetical protein PIROE2DRAFT_2915 [Piromyces sp. E2]